MLIILQTMCQINQNYPCTWLCSPPDFEVSLTTGVNYIAPSESRL